MVIFRKLFCNLFVDNRFESASPWNSFKDESLRNISSKNLIAPTNFGILPEKYIPEVAVHNEKIITNETIYSVGQSLISSYIENLN